MKIVFVDSTFVFYVFKHFEGLLTKNSSGKKEASVARQQGARFCFHTSPTSPCKVKPNKVTHLRKATRAVFYIIL